ncbi:hypothetical protein BLA29_006033, partial [Euroglyphus maynei]
MKTNENFSHSLMNLKPENMEQSSTKCHQKEIYNVQLDKLLTEIKILNNEIEVKNEENVNLKRKLANLDRENRNIRKIISSLINNIVHWRDEMSNDNHHGNNDDEWNEKINKLEEKLLLYRQQLESKQNDLIEMAEEVQSSESDQMIKIEDLPVQGPIPEEPDEKLYWSPPRKNQDRNRI